MKREMTLTIDSDSANEAFARTVVADYDRLQDLRQTDRSYCAR